MTSLIPWQSTKVFPGPAFPRSLLPIGQRELVVPLPNWAITSAFERPGTQNQVCVMYMKLADGRESNIAEIGADGKITFQFSFEAWFGQLTLEEYRKPHSKPLSAYLPFHYHRVPGFIRNLAAAGLLQVSRLGGEKAATDLGYTDFTPGCDILCQLYHQKKSAKIAQPTLILTHDIDTSEGLKGASKILALEQTYGFRSSWNVVPLSYKLDDGLLGELKAAGGEIGLHGLSHDNRECFQPRALFEDSIKRLAPLFERYQIKGYRSPSWYRHPQLYDWLKPYFLYDLSTLDTDRVCPGGPGGVGVMDAFQWANGLWELPCTLPFEGPLLYGLSAEALLDYWKEKISYVHKQGRLLLVNTHPDPNYLGISEVNKAYQKLLGYLSALNWRHCLPGELVIASSGR